MSNEWHDRLVQMGIDPDKAMEQGYADIPDGLPSNYFQKSNNQGNVSRVVILQTIGDCELNEAETRWLSYWNLYGDKLFGIPSPQYHFNPETEQRADFAFEKQCVLVEVDGMTGHDGHEGAHRSYPGYGNDRKRDMTAMKLGWLIVRFPTYWMSRASVFFRGKESIEDLNSILRYR